MTEYHLDFDFVFDCEIPKDTDTESQNHSESHRMLEMSL